MMNCKDVKSRLADPEFVDGSMEAPALKEHLKKCTTCRQLYNLDATLDGEIKKALKPPAMPEHLMESLEMTVAQEMTDKKSLSECRPFFKKGMIKFAAPALAVAILLIAILMPLGKNGFNLEEIGRLAVKDHIKQLPMTFQAGLVPDIPAWFKGVLDFGIAMPTLEVEALGFLGGRKCHLGKSDVAYLMYSRNNDRVSLFIVNPADLAVKVTQATSYQTVEEGCKVKMWAENSLLYVMVD